MAASDFIGSLLKGAAAGARTYGAAASQAAQEKEAERKKAEQEKKAYQDQLRTLSTLAQNDERYKTAYDYALAKGTMLTPFDQKFLPDIMEQEKAQADMLAGYLRREDNAAMGRGMLDPNPAPTRSGINFGQFAPDNVGVMGENAAQWSSGKRDELAAQGKKAEKLQTLRDELAIRKSFDKPTEPVDREQKLVDDLFAQHDREMKDYGRQFDAYQAKLEAWTANNKQGPEPKAPKLPDPKAILSRRFSGRLKGVDQKRLNELLSDAFPLSFGDIAKGIGSQPAIGGGMGGASKSIPPNDGSMTDAEYQKFVAGVKSGRIKL